MDIAVAAHDHRLCVRKDSGNLKAAGAFDIHEIRVGGLHQSLQFVSVKLQFRTGVEKIARHD